MENKPKTLLKISTYVFFGLLLSCSGKKDVSPANCEASGERASAALNAYIADPENKTKCEAYKSALRDIFQSCPTYYTGATKQSMEELLAATCP
ncbi:hypothetical protein GCM10027275_33320 [Rhabdobacter roseus]|uniref:Lipoprotein n=1 Tax=Rhabdobacter roseus TaxID=1655419 RepID=A0A840TR94_9BACT|nr:hypothetical protein [Rhabdobacter roseus]MBB5285445.1 hypothetical protein [Rhabdobacter roseus]